jgi:hypothetical protein
VREPYRYEARVAPPPSAVVFFAFLSVTHLRQKGYKQDWMHDFIASGMIK